MKPVYSSSPGVDLRPLPLALCWALWIAASLGLWALIAVIL